MTAKKTTEAIKNQLATTEASKRAPSPTELLQRTLDEQAPAFGVLLPKGREREKFELQLATAIKATPALLQCLSTTQGKISLILAARQAASLGLEVNTLLRESSLEPRKNKGIDECRLNIEWRGYVKLAEQATGGKIDAQVVREGDHFLYGYSLERDFLDHTPGDDDEADKISAWARIRFPDGRTQFVVMGRKAIEKRRAMSDSWKNDKSRPYSPWTKWEDEQWLKTVIRTLCKRIQISPVVATALDSDEAPLVIDTADVAAGPQIVANYEQQDDSFPEAIEAAEAKPEAPAEPADEDPGRPFTDD